MDLNKVMIIGRLTADPEARTTPNGTSVTSFSVATNRVWKDQQGNQQDRVEYHDVVTWRRLAEICAQYLAKGRQIYIEGYLQTRSWEGKDGKKNYRTEIIADNMIMLGNKSDAPRPAQQQQQQQGGQEQSQPAPEQQNQRIQESAPTGEVSDEEIKIEDIPF